MIPKTRVAIEFGLIPLAANNFFTLDDPIKGVLDSVDFALGGGAFIDITDEVKEVSVSRGRSKQFDSFQAGSANVVLSNERRQFDPTNPPDLGVRENLSSNPSFDVDLTGYGAGESFFTVGESQRFNLLGNPSFEAGLTGWDSGASVITGPPVSLSVSGLEHVQGSQSALVTISHGSSGEGIHYSVTGLSPGTTYTVTAYVKPELGTTSQLITRDVTHEVGGTVSATGVGGSWTRLVSTITTGGIAQFTLDSSLLDDPSTTLGGDVTVLIGVTGDDFSLPGDFVLDDPINGVLGASSLVSEPLFYVDAVMLEVGSVVLPYFDGSNSNSSLNDGLLSWSGTVGLSPSVLTWVIPSISRSTSLARYGLSSALVEVNTRFARQGIFTTISGLEFDTTYIVSAYVYVRQGSPVQMSTRSGTVNGSSSTVTSLAGWTRLSSVITTGSVEGFVLDSPEILVVFYTTTEFITPGVGPFSVFNVDAVLVEEGFVVLPYFDGGLADSSIALPEVSWEGTPGLSRSLINFLVPGTGSPYWPEVKPRKRLRIETDSVSVFLGTIEDWNYDYPQSNDSRATLSASDAFAFFANALIDPVEVPEELSGARVDRVLSSPEINWPTDFKDIDTGGSTLALQNVGGDTDPKPVNALQYLQEVEQAEQGALFINPAGVLRFRERTASQVLSGVKFCDDGTGVPFMDISVDYGVEALRNRVIINRLGGSLITVEDSPSITEYGPFSLEVRDSLLSDDTQAEDWAVRVVEQYKEPVLRIDTITVDVRSLTTGQVEDVLLLDLGDVVEVAFTPNRVGSPIVQTVQIDGISHSIQVTNHRVSFDVSQIVL